MMNDDAKPKRCKIRDYRILIIDQNNLKIEIF